MLAQSSFINSTHIINKLDFVYAECPFQFFRSKETELKTTIYLLGNFTYISERYL